MRRGEENMKKMKKVLAMILSFVMMMSMTMTTIAAPGGTATLTVNKVPTGQNVYLYKLLNVEKTTAGVGNETYDYTLDDTNVAINTALKKVLKINTAMTAEDVYNAVSIMDKTQIAELARNLVSDITVNNATTSKTATGSTTVTFENLTDGYYLIYSPNTVSAIQTVAGTTGNTVTLKSDLPIVDKDSDVKPDAGAVVGQVITYTVKTTVPNVSGFDLAKYKFTLTDKLSDGLDFVTKPNGTVEVHYSIDSIPKVEGALEGTLSTPNNRTMTVDLKDIVLKNQQHEGKTFTLTYKAKLNKDAVVENNNEAKIEYSNNPNVVDQTTTTTPDKEFTPTYKLMVKKTASDTKDYLAGAVFELHEGTAEGTVVKVEGTEGEYVYAADQNATQTTEMTTKAGKLAGGEYNLSLNGLKAGTYYLVEKTAPQGYNKIDPIKVVIKSTGANEGVTAGNYTITVGEPGEEDQDKIIEIVNKKGTLLPETGGMGTVIFTVVAVVLILGVAVSFVFSRRKGRR